MNERPNVCNFTTFTTTPLPHRVRETRKDLLLEEIPPDATLNYCIIAYCVLFAISLSGNVTVFHSVLKEYRRSQSRIALLILHLSIADLIVCCTVIPTEIFWRITVQWLGGNGLCKICQFMRAFGLYLGSMVLICMSLDRFVAILFPLEMLNRQGTHRVKAMLWVAWVASLSFAMPQAILFSVVTHPQLPSFQQCVTNSLLNNLENVRIYSIFSVSALYFIPLAVILFTYISILIKLIRKTHRLGQDEHFQEAQVRYKRSSSGSALCILRVIKRNYSDVREYGLNSKKNSWDRMPLSPSSSHPSTPLHERKAGLIRNEIQSGCPEGGDNVADRLSSIRKTSSMTQFDSGYNARKSCVLLRQSGNAKVTMTNARNRALVTTIVTVSAFVICWTPYVVMTMWYILDWEGAENVDQRVQDFLFIMAIANSCVNPMIYYGSFSKNCW